MSQQVVIKVSSIKFDGNSSSGAALIYATDGRTSRQMNMMNLIDVFANIRLHIKSIPIFFICKI
jgi:hypothetical protein